MSFADWLEAVRRNAVASILARAVRRDRGLKRWRHARRNKQQNYWPERLEPRVVLSSPPVVSAMTYFAPATPNTNLTSVSYSIGFSESVSGVVAADFRAVTSGSVAQGVAVGVTGSGAAYTVTVSNIHGNGGVQLELVDNDTILDSASNPLGGTGNGNGSFVGPTYYILQAGPQVLSIARGNPTSAVIPSNTTTVSYTVTFNEAVTGVAASDFSIVTSGSVTDSGAVVTPLSGSVYTVTVNGINGLGTLGTLGTLGVNLVDNGAIRDLAGNPLQSDPGGAVSFTNQQTIALSATPFTDVIADVNGDGKPDLIIGSTPAGTVGALLGNGNGTFQAEKTYSVGTQGTSYVAVADVNGDGKPDLVLSNAVSVGIMLGNGDGTFLQQQTINVGNNFPGGVAVADVNGDGYPDVIVLNSSNIGVLIGNGDGTFKPQATFATPGFSPSGIAVADLNGDGHPDIVVGSNDDSSIRVMLNNGNGTFQAPVAYLAGYKPESISIADINSDGKFDVVTANQGASVNTVSVFTGNGDGTFAPQHTLAVGTTPYAAQIADLNGDGNLDIVVTNGGSATVGVLLGNGNGTFQTQQTLGVVAYPAMTAVGDLNGDGRPDLVTATGFTNTASVFLNTGSDSVTGPAYTIQAAAPYLSIAQQPTGAIAGSTIGNVVVDVDTISGAINTGDASIVTLTLSRGVFSTGVNTATATAINGVATFSGLIINAAGSYRRRHRQCGNRNNLGAIFHYAGDGAGQRVAIRCHDRRPHPRCECVHYNYLASKGCIRKQSGCRRIGRRIHPVRRRNQRRHNWRR